MILNKKFEYPEVEQVTLPAGFRYYVCPETGFKMASVTTILDATADKAWLDNWVAWVGERKAQFIKEEAASMGSLMHTHVECFIEGVERPSARTPQRVMARDMADQIITNGLCHVDEIWGVETRLFVSGLYAGTTDIVGVYKGKPAIMDHKSARKMKKKKDITEYRDQLAAYALAHNLRYGTEIEHGVVFMADRAGNFNSFEFDFNEMLEGTSSFLDRTQLYYENAPKDFFNN